jgi:F-type H+-transporting ATPase subunit a
VSNSDTKTKKRVPVKRWLVLILVGLGIYAAFIGPSYLKPISPLVVLPGEPTGLAIGSFEITNTTLATLLTDVVLVLLAFSALRFSKSGKTVPEGMYNAFEAIIEFLWNTVEDALGNQWAKRAFPVVATIFLIVFTANMVKMVPGFESIGYMKEAHGGYGYKPVDMGFFYSLDAGHPISEAADHGEEAAHGEDTSHGEDAGHAAAIDMNGYYEVVPFLRGSATDLNFPLALAVIAVVMIQVYGVWALGPGYFSKFFQIDALINGGIFGGINFAVGLLEVVLELAKVLSFAFRLFGNIFAGALLLSIVGALTAVVVPAGLYLFEVFFGIIQAYVFFLLTVAFISGALVSHHGDDHH